MLVRVGQYPAGSFISSVTACWDLTCILAGMMVVLHKDKLGDLTTALCHCMLEPYCTVLGQVMYKNLIKTRWASELKKNGID